MIGAALLLCLLPVLVLLKWRFGGAAHTPPTHPVAAAVADPRLTFDTPYRNVRPDVKYVGDEACAGCHRQISHSYHQHPMGRSLAAVPEPADAQPPVPAGRPAVEALGFQYWIERRGDRVRHRETFRTAQGQVIADRAGEVRYVIGSGTRGYTYLIEQDGYLLQSPISWYGAKKVWDLSPGYRENNQHFDRVVPVGCLFCHANHAEAVPDTVNHYVPPIFRGLAIGCERCHGPGELHVRRHTEGEPLEDEIDDTIVNPKDLEPALREAVCQQCHLQGQGRTPRRGRDTFDYRPGLPLDLFWSVFVWRPEAAHGNQAVGQVEQMYASRCFRASSGKLGCISCHDPHRKPAENEKAAYYRERCLKCHQENSCRLPLTTRRQRDRDDSCAACHMPRLADTDIIHIAATDHRIPRRPSGKPVHRGTGIPARAASPRAGMPVPQPFAPWQTPIVAFHRDPRAKHDREDDRDLGVVLIEMASQAAEPVRKRLTLMALPVLQDAVLRAADDIEAGEAKGYALRWQGDLTEALSAYEAVLARAPRREISLAEAATVAEQLGRSDLARDYWRRAIAVNPLRYHYHSHLAQVHAGRREWTEALAECETALRLNPARADVRMLQVRILLDRGDRERARAAFEALLAMQPARQDDLRRWFEARLRP